MWQQCSVHRRISSYRFLQATITFCFEQYAHGWANNVLLLVLPLTPFPPCIAPSISRSPQHPEGEPCTTKNKKRAWYNVNVYGPFDNNNAQFEYFLSTTLRSGTSRVHSCTALVGRNVFFSFKQLQAAKSSASFPPQIDNTLTQNITFRRQTSDLDGHSQPGLYRARTTREDDCFQHITLINCLRGVELAGGVLGRYFNPGKKTYF